MVIGNGLLASAFLDNYLDDEEIVIFASGVSNSNEMNDEAYSREKNLLSETINNITLNQKLIYFSTCSIYDKAKSKDKYVLHKQNMENYIIDKVQNYYIFRLPQVIGISENNYTLLNFLYRNIINKNKIKIFANAKRNIIDIVDIKAIVIYLIENNLYQNSILNVANKVSYTLLEIVKCFEELLNISADIDLVDEGSVYDIDISVIETIYTHLDINFEKYLCSKIIKYYKDKK